jgi:hypothetical protein
MTCCGRGPICGVTCVSHLINSSRKPRRFGGTAAKRKPRLPSGPRLEPAAVRRAADSLAPSLQLPPRTPGAGIFLPQMSRTTPRRCPPCLPSQTVIATSGRCRPPRCRRARFRLLQMPSSQVSPQGYSNPSGPRAAASHCCSVGRKPRPAAERVRLPPRNADHRLVRRIVRGSAPVSWGHVIPFAFTHFQPSSDHRSRFRVPAGLDEQRVLRVGHRVLRQPKRFGRS